MKVLIADDESIIRNGIRSTVDWKRLGLEAVDTASNGPEAYGKIVAWKPDIVLIDIKMPGMDGLEIIARSPPDVPPWAYVILSGYGEFPFAQKALQLGVRHYLLKPVDRELLEKTLAEVRDRVREEGARARERAETGSRLSAALPLARKELLAKCLEDSLSERERDLLRHGLQPATGVFLVLIDGTGCSQALLDGIRRSIGRRTAPEILIAGAVLDHRVALLCLSGTGMEDEGLAERARVCAAEMAPGSLPCASARGAFKDVRSLYRSCRERFGTAGVEAGEGRDASGPRSEAVGRLLDFLERNYQEESIRLGKLAHDELHLNPDYLGKLFKAEMRVSFSRYLNGLRVERAKEYLRQHPDAPIHETAFRHGFGYNVQYFSRVFKNLAGTTPQEFRARFR